MPVIRKRASLIAAMSIAWVGAAAGVETKGALYADLRLSFDATDDASATPGPTYTVTDNNSVWGVKASTVKGRVTVFGGYERFVDEDQPVVLGFPIELTRQAYLGITSFCGTIKAGRHSTEYAEAGRKLDVFYNTAVSGSGGLAAAGSIFGGGNSHGTSTAFNADTLGNAYVANHISYQSPAYWGVTGNAAFFTHETGDADQDHDYGAGVEYAGNGVTAGLQYLDVNGANASTWGIDGATSATRLYAGYARERFGAGLSYEMLDLSAGAEDATYLMLSGWYGLREDTRFAASFGLEDASVSDGSSVRIGLFHDVLDSFTVWAAARHFSGSLLPDADVITFGASYKFSLGFSS